MITIAGNAEGRMQQSCPKAGGLEPVRDYCGIMARALLQQACNVILLD
jgi:hypothetical protein